MTCHLKASFHRILLLLFLLTSLAEELAAKKTTRTRTLNVIDLGAKPDGHADLAGPLSRAWAVACESTTPSTIHIPKGKFYLSRASFRGPCKNEIALRINGTVTASPNYDDPSNGGGHGRWISFDNVGHVSIIGGTLDGQGRALWACKSASKRRCPEGVTNLVLNNAEDVKITDLTSMDSKLYHIVIDKCRRVALHGVSIVAPGNSPNTDGIHVQRSSSVVIAGTTIGTGDDCVSIGPGTKDLLIERVSCGPGHGISIGSLGKSMEEEGVENVTVKKVALKNTQNGLRIKCWGRPSKGFVRRVAFRHASMNNVHNPIIIDQNYCPQSQGCPDQEDSGVEISHVAYRDVHGTSATPVAVMFQCSSSTPCRGIGLEDIRITYGKEEAKSLCKNARGFSSGHVAPPSCL